MRQNQNGSENDLDRIAIKYGTDKATAKVGALCAKGYTAQYSRHLAHLRDQPIKLLEIGIAEGASLKMWEEYFPNAQIYGIDILPECRQYGTDRTKVFIGDQKDRAFLSSVSEAVEGPIDVVIDDGGHKMSQHSVSLEVLFPCLKAGGFYAIEDLHTSYMSTYEGGYLSAESTIEYLKELIDGLNRAYALKEHLTLLQWARRKVLSQKPRPLPDWLDDLEGIHFYRSIAFLTKKP